MIAGLAVICLAFIAAVGWMPRIFCVRRKRKKRRHQSVHRGAVSEKSTRQQGIRKGSRSKHGTSLNASSRRSVNQQFSPLPLDDPECSTDEESDIFDESLLQQASRSSKRKSSRCYGVMQEKDTHRSHQPSAAQNSRTKRYTVSAKSITATGPKQAAKQRPVAGLYETEFMPVSQPTVLLPGQSSKRKQTDAVKLGSFTLVDLDADDAQATCQLPHTAPQTVMNTSVTSPSSAFRKKKTKQSKSKLGEAIL